MRDLVGSRAILYLMERAESEVHPHSRIAEVIGDLVYGAHDGIITTFAVVAGVTGASLNLKIVVILGAANLIADGISMAASSYLGRKSEHQAFLHQRSIEEWEVRHEPEEEKGEIKNILLAKGYRGEDLERMTDLITRNPKFWVDFMMNEERGIKGIQDSRNPLRSAVATFFAFVAAGSIPLMPYLPLLSQMKTNFFSVSIAASALALFGVGAIRGVIVGKKWYFLGFEVLGVGCVAGASAYLVGFLLKAVIGS